MRWRIRDAVGDPRCSGGSAMRSRIRNAGADAVLFSEDSVDIYNGKCVRSSAGSIFHVPVAVDVSASEMLTLAQQSGLISLAAAAGGELGIPTASDILGRPTMWLFGNEAHGLATELAGAADY